MRALRIMGTGAAFAVLLFGSALVFQTFDRYSHSASDTLLSFIITMAPVWAVAIAGVWVLLRPPTEQPGRRAEDDESSS